jgi:hypothetical protein
MFSKEGIELELLEIMVHQSEAIRVETNKVRIREQEQEQTVFNL